MREHLFDGRRPSPLLQPRSCDYCVGKTRHIPPREFPLTDDVFDALAHPLRRRLLMELRTGAKTASELAADMPVGRPAVAEHMQALRRAGLVKVERRGRRRVHHLDPRPLAEVGGWLNLMLAHWAKRIEDLQGFEAL